MNAGNANDNTASIGASPSPPVGGGDGVDRLLKRAASAAPSYDGNEADDATTANRRPSPPPLLPNSGVHGGASTIAPPLPALTTASSVAANNNCLSSSSASSQSPPPSPPVAIPSSSLPTSAAVAGDDAVKIGRTGSDGGADAVGTVPQMKKSAAAVPPPFDTYLSSPPFPSSPTSSSQAAATTARISPPLAKGANGGGGGGEEAMFAFDGDDRRPKTADDANNGNRRGSPPLPLLMPTAAGSSGSNADAGGSASSNGGWAGGGGGTEGEGGGPLGRLMPFPSTGGGSNSNGGRRSVGALPVGGVEHFVSSPPYAGPASPSNNMESGCDRGSIFSLPEGAVSVSASPPAPGAAVAHLPPSSSSARAAPHPQQRQQQRPSLFCSTRGGGGGGSGNGVKEEPQSKTQGKTATRAASPHEKEAGGGEGRPSSASAAAVAFHPISNSASHSHSHSQSPSQSNTATPCTATSNHPLLPSKDAPHDNPKKDTADGRAASSSPALAAAPAAATSTGGAATATATFPPPRPQRGDVLHTTARDSIPLGRRRGGLSSLSSVSGASNTPQNNGAAALGNSANVGDGGPILRSIAADGEGGEPSSATDADAGGLFASVRSNRSGNAMLLSKSAVPAAIVEEVGDPVVAAAMAAMAAADEADGTDYRHLFASADDSVTSTSGAFENPNQHQKQQQLMPSPVISCVGSDPLQQSYNRRLRIALTLAEANHNGDHGGNGGHDGHAHHHHHRHHSRRHLGSNGHHHRNSKEKQKGVGTVGVMISPPTEGGGGGGGSTSTISSSGGSNASSPADNAAGAASSPADSLASSASVPPSPLFSFCGGDGDDYYKNGCIGEWRVRPRWRDAGGGPTRVAPRLHGFQWPLNFTQQVPAWGFIVFFFILFVLFEVWALREMLMMPDGAPIYNVMMPVLNSTFEETFAVRTTTVVAFDKDLYLSTSPPSSPFPPPVPPETSDAAVGVLGIAVYISDMPLTAKGKTTTALNESDGDGGEDGSEDTDEGAAAAAAEVAAPLATAATAGSSTPTSVLLGRTSGHLPFTKQDYTYASAGFIVLVVLFCVLFILLLVFLVYVTRKDVTPQVLLTTHRSDRLTSAAIERWGADEARRKAANEAATVVIAERAKERVARKQLRRALWEGRQQAKRRRMAGGGGGEVGGFNGSNNGGGGRPAVLGSPSSPPASAAEAAAALAGALRGDRGGGSSPPLSASLNPASASPAADHHQQNDNEKQGLHVSVRDHVAARAAALAQRQRTDQREGVMSPLESQFDSSEGEELLERALGPAPTIRPEPTVKPCYWCRIFVPLDAHHCRLCQKCVFGFDHHCAFLNTCVGHDNYVSFFVFVWTTLLSAAFVFAIGIAVAVWVGTNRRAARAVYHRVLGRHDERLSASSAPPSWSPQGGLYVVASASDEESYYYNSGSGSSGRGESAFYNYKLKQSEEGQQQPYLSPSSSSLSFVEASAPSSFPFEEKAAGPFGRNIFSPAEAAPREAVFGHPFELYVPTVLSQRTIVLNSSVTVLPTRQQQPSQQQPMISTSAAVPQGLTLATTLIASSPSDSPSSSSAFDLTSEPASTATAASVVVSPTPASSSSEATATTYVLYTRDVEHVDVVEILTPLFNDEADVGRGTDPEIYVHYSTTPHTASGASSSPFNDGAEADNDSHSDAAAAKPFFAAAAVAAAAEVPSGLREDGSDVANEEVPLQPLEECAVAASKVSPPLPRFTLPPADVPAHAPRTLRPAGRPLPLLSSIPPRRFASATNASTTTTTTTNSNTALLSSLQRAAVFVRGEVLIEVDSDIDGLYFKRRFSSGPLAGDPLEGFGSYAYTVVFNGAADYFRYDILVIVLESVGLLLKFVVLCAVAHLVFFHLRLRWRDETTLEKILRKRAKKAARRERKRKRREAEEQEAARTEALLTGQRPLAPSAA